ncbi:hypothetical protein F5148DRAFT_1184824 [Russula earlei]|uniref:Uncharacterized protein n=1 Tax=Russula earlei TaxID=71964 RepID=A0ACC0UEB6_9AGAM|nr:hypothetical protein F5148DRAFT_1184824 [Russula earlei]
MHTSSVLAIYCFVVCAYPSFANPVIIRPELPAQVQTDPTAPETPPPPPYTTVPPPDYTRFFRYGERVLLVHIPEPASPPKRPWWSRMVSKLRRPRPQRPEKSLYTVM